MDKLFKVLDELNLVRIIQVFALVLLVYNLCIALFMLTQYATPFGYDFGAAVDHLSLNIFNILWKFLTLLGLARVIQILGAKENNNA